MRIPAPHPCMLQSPKKRENKIQIRKVFFNRQKELKRFSLKKCRTKAALSVSHCFGITWNECIVIRYHLSFNGMYIRVCLDINGVASVFRFALMTLSTPPVFIVHLVARTFRVLYLAIFCVTEIGKWKVGRFICCGRFVPGLESRKQNILVYFDVWRVHGAGWGAERPQECMSTSFFF